MANNPTLLTMPIAENGQKNTIPATQAAAGDGLLSQSTGFPPETALPLGAGGKAPTREDFNGAFNLLSDIAFYTQKGWTFEYDANQTYYKGCIVMDTTNGLRYECINDVAAGTILPSADTNNDYWHEYSPGGVPLGTILPYAANAAEPPYSFLFCEGQAISRTMYPDLFALIGTTYGAGDGSTTFNLPNLVGKYPQGDTTAGTVKSAGLPNITGQIYAGQRLLINSITDSKLAGISGAFSNMDAVTENSRVYAGGTETSGTSQRRVRFNASRSNSIYGNSDTVTPPTLTVRWIIKAYDAPTPSSAQIDLSQYASDLANKAYRRRPRKAFTLADLIAAVQTGNYNEYDICPGDYYVGASGYTYIFAGDNPLRGTYTGYPIEADHAGLIVDTHETCKWNDTNDTTGGYVSSKLHAYLVNTVLPKVKTDLGGVGHLYAHRKLYSTSINKTGYNRYGAATGCANNWAWSENQYIAALSEVQVYGSIVWSSSGYDTGEADEQLEVFRRFKHTEIFGNEYPWLRDVVSSSVAAAAASGGSAANPSASNAYDAAGLICFH